MANDDEITDVRKSSVIKDEQEITEVENLPVFERRRIFLLLSILLVVLIAGILIVRSRQQPVLPRERQNSRTPASPSKKVTSSQSFKVSHLEFVGPEGTAVNSMTLKTGQTVLVKFYVFPQKVPSGKVATFTASLRIYSIAGALLLYKRDLASFADTLNADQERLLVETKLVIAPDAPPGVYRLMIDVTDTHSGRQASVQGRFRIVGN